MLSLLKMNSAGEPLLIIPGGSARHHANLFYI